MVVGSSPTHERYLVVKWPFEERVQFSLHEYKEHREMGLVSNTISIEVGSDPHLIPITVWRKYTVLIMYIHY